VVAGAPDIVAAYSAPAARRQRRLGAISACDFSLARASRR
jgi:hypothetical protein